MKALVIIPTYNERENIARVVTRVRALNDVDVLVADDSSPDGTGGIADGLAAADPRVHVLHRAGKEGLGRAYLAGFRWGLERGYSHLVEMDADGSHRPEDLGRLLMRAVREDAPDLVIGSRYVPGGRVVNWPRSREALSRGGNLYTRLWLGLPTNDSTAGFRVYRADLLGRLPLEQVAAAGYYFQVEMTRRTWLAGGRIVEVPITFVERELGTSKMSRAIVLEALAHTTRLGIARRWGQLVSVLKKRRTA